MDTRIFDKVDEPMGDDNNEPQQPDKRQSEQVISFGAAPNQPGSDGGASAEMTGISDKTEKKKTAAKKKSGHAKEEKGPSKFIEGIYDWTSALLTAVVVVVIVMTFCFRMVDVDGSSMMNTLQDGDRVIITGLDYEPRVGDVVVISHGVELDKTIVKRIIAVGGQTVDIDFDTGEVMVDGIVLDEPYILGETTVSADVEFPLTVTEGTVFVLGDNRVISKDSRYAEVGLIDVNNIIGEVQLRVYPFDSFGFVE